MGYQDPGCIHGGHSLGHTYNLCWLHFLSCLQVRPFGGTDMPVCLPSPKSWTQTLKAGSNFRDDQIRVSFLASGRMREDEVTPSLVDFELEPSSVCPSSDSRRRQDQDLTKDSDTHTLTCLTDTRAIHRRTDSVVFTATARGTVYPIASQRTRGRAVNSLEEHKQQIAATFPNRNHSSTNKNSLRRC